MKLFYDPQTGLVSRWARIGGGVSYAGLAEHDAADIDDPLSVYVYAGAVHPLPARPGAWAVFDPASGAWTDPRTPAEVAADDAAALSSHRLSAIATVNAIAGEVRKGFITWIPGQEMLYLTKEAEARAWQADPAPVLADYPLIAAEIGITAATAGDLAALWLTMGAQWRAAAAQIETARLGTVKAIEDAADKAGVDAAVTAYRGVMGA